MANSTTCIYCNETTNDITKDHVIPKCRHGVDTVPCCKTCNADKKDLSIVAWYKQLFKHKKNERVKTIIKNLRQLIETGEYTFLSDDLCIKEKVLPKPDVPYKSTQKVIVKGIDINLGKDSAGFTISIAGEENKVISRYNVPDCNAVVGEKVSHVETSIVEAPVILGKIELPKERVKATPPKKDNRKK